MTHTQTVDHLVIKSGNKNPTKAILQFPSMSFPCIIGGGGSGVKRAEGDGITPVGRWQPLFFLYRKDRLAKPISLLPGFTISQNDSWCDNPASARYNLPLAIVPDLTAERLWRDDNLYDLIVVLNHNTFPQVNNRGSAVFLHLFNEHTRHTQGCIAFAKNNLVKIIQVIDHRTTITISR